MPGVEVGLRQAEGQLAGRARRVLVRQLEQHVAAREVLAGRAAARGRGVRARLALPLGLGPEEVRLALVEYGEGREQHKQRAVGVVRPLALGDGPRRVGRDLGADPQPLGGVGEQRGQLERALAGAALDAERAAELLRGEAGEEGVARDADAVAAGVEGVRGEGGHARCRVQPLPVAHVAPAQRRGARAGRGELSGLEPERGELGVRRDVDLSHEARRGLLLACGVALQQPSARPGGGGGGQRGIDINAFIWRATEGRPPRCIRSLGIAIIISVGVIILGFTSALVPINRNRIT